ncbi:MAG: carbohydrate-binding domain-containing protein [Clostridia bacterium]|nr:carbohydrate-binding domain-containing protein [Clostridia bacterium]MDY6184053.1 carbohydrate-binding domain-containing protein [Eubacteriales bacterium]
MIGDAPAGDDGYSPGGSHRPTDDDPETDTTLTFTAIDTKTVYAITGYLAGNIVIDVGDTYKFDLELTGFTLTSNTVNPITILSGTKRARKGISPYGDRRHPVLTCHHAGRGRRFFVCLFPVSAVGRSRAEKRAKFFSSTYCFFSKL